MQCVMEWSKECLMPRHKKEQTLSQYIYDTSLTLARDGDNMRHCNELP